MFVGRQIRGVFVMGGVYADAAPLTMPSLPNVLNRFSRYSDSDYQIVAMSLEYELK